jgi:hypothetical protein
MSRGPDQPAGGSEYPSEPLEYPADAGLPPPVYPSYPPQYGAAYYPGAYDPYRPTKPPGTNGKAITALVTAIAGMFCCGLPSIAGLIFGVIAMRETRRTGQDGYAIALVATIIGGLVTAGWILYVLLTIGLYASSWQWAP